MAKRVLICGGRGYSKYSVIEGILDELDISVIIHGGALGADSLAAFYGAKNGILVKKYPADWELYGKRAGYVRNVQMLEEGKPDLVVAFPGGKGTAMMIDLAKRAGVEVLEVKDG